MQDMSIARHLRALNDKIEIRFVSYGTGADTFARAGEHHIDLDFPDKNPILETLVVAGKLIGWLDPDLVVAHEEFIALPAAKIFDKPTVLLTDWFTDPAKPTMTTLPFADRILFLDEPGIFEEPEAARGKVEYVAAVVRELRYTREDRLRARQEIGIPVDVFLLLVLPGSLREEASPAADLVLAAFDRLPYEPKQLIWVAGADSEQLIVRAGMRPNVTILDFAPEVDRLMVAADVAITKGTRTTMQELTALCVPSVSLHNEANEIDNVRAPRFPYNLAAGASAGPEEIASLIRQSADRATPPRATDTAGGSACARALLRLVQAAAG